jgi:hypothetical protein
MVQHSMDDTSQLKDEEFDGRRDKETPPNLNAIIRSLKAYNGRLMRARVEQEELNAILLQILFEIQKHLQQGPSNEKLQLSERLKTPSDAQNHRVTHNNVGRISSRKKHQDDKRCKLSGGVSKNSSS